MRAKANGRKGAYIYVLAAKPFCHTNIYQAKLELLSSGRMKVEKYHLKSDETFTYFEFTSVGLNGAIRKMIEFQTTSTPNLFNLAFGDKNPETGELDDLVISNNGDTQKVLGTIVSALYVFFDRNPESLVYATGSTPARTRLYKMGITKFYNEIQADFYLYGRINDKLHIFEKGIDYEGFLAQRKFE